MFLSKTSSPITLLIYFVDDLSKETLKALVSPLISTTDNVNSDNGFVSILAPLIDTVDPETLLVKMSAAYEPRGLNWQTILSA